MRNTTLAAACAAIASVIALALPAVSSASTTIDTTPSWDGSTNEHTFGDPNTATYGQTITVPSGGDHALQSFTFYIKLPTTLVFRGEVYAWDGSKAVGPALYESAPTHTTDSGVFQPITFDTGKLALKPGEQYVLFGSISRDSTPDSTSGDVGQWGKVASDVYPGGNLVFINNGYDPSKWTSTTWDGNLQGLEMAFSASFTAATGKVLILGTAAAPADGVTGHASWEEVEARALGDDVDVVDGGTWDSMSAAQFAAYDAILIPDHRDCTGSDTGRAAAQANTGAWTPAVTGRVLLTGTDAEDHAELDSPPDNAHAQAFIQAAIAFAASVPGRTGAYVALPCRNSGGVIDSSVLGGFGSFTVNAKSEDTSHLDPAVTGPAGVTDATLTGWGTTAHSWFSSFPAPFQVWGIGKDATGPYTTSDGQVGFPNELVRAGVPTAVTGLPSGVTTSGATMNGTVNPGGGATNFHFDYGLTPNYGASTPSGSAGSGVANVPESATLGGLAQGTTVHYRLVASNSTGTHLGADQTFRTATVAALLAQLSLQGNVKLSGDVASFTLACRVTTCNGDAIETTREKLQGSKVLGVSAARKKKIRKKTVTVGRTAFSLAPGTTKKITVKLNGTGRKLEKKFKKLPVTLTIRLNGTTVKATHLTLKPKKKKHKRKH